MVGHNVAPELDIRELDRAGDVTDAIGLVGLQIRAVRELNGTSLRADPKIGRSGIQLDKDLCTACVNTMDQNGLHTDVP